MATKDFQSDAKKAAFEAAYKAAITKKPMSQGAVNKVFAEELKKSTAPKETKISGGIAAGSYTRQNPTYNGKSETQQKLDDAQTAYDRYLASNEYKQKLDKVGRRLMRDDAKAKELNATVEHYRQQLQAEADQRVMDADLKELESWSEEDRKNLEQYDLRRDQQAILATNPISALHFTFDSFKNPIVDKYGYEKVSQMAETYRRSKNAERMEMAKGDAKKFAGDGFLSGTASSAVSVPANLVGSISGTLGYLDEAVHSTGRYSTLDPNNRGNLLSVFGQTVRSEVAENIQGDEESTNWLRKLAALGYQGGMSALDSAARIAVSGGSSGISSALAASGAFSNGLRQYSQQGASPEQAAAMALTSAGLEYVTEKLPTDKVLDMFKKGGGKGVVRDILTQAFLVEPTSEEVNLFAGVAAEAMILGDKSGAKQQIGELVANGMSYDEARAQYYKSLWNEALQTYAVSAFSGLASSGGAAIVGNAVKNSQQTQTQQQATPAASEVDEKAQAQQIIENTASELAQNAPAPAPAQPMTENQQHLENAVAETLGVEPQNAVRSEAVAEQNQEDQNAESIKENLWKNYRGKQDENAVVTDGWQAVTDNSVWATALAMKEVNPEYFNAYMKSADNEQLSPLIDAVINAAEDVRQESISPMAAATVINEVYEQYGEAGLRKMYNPKNGNLYENVLNRMKAVDSTRGKYSETDAAAGDIKGTGAAEQNFSGKAQYQDLLYEGNVQRDRPGDVRPMEVPKTDPYGRNVSETVGNLYGAEITPDEMANQIEELVQEGALGFDRRSNQDALNDAAAAIEAKGASRIRDQITRNVANGKLADGDIEKAMLLYSSYANKNGTRAQASAAEILVDLTTMAHMTGRNLQLFKLLRKLTPEGQLMAINQTVQRSVESMIRSGQVKKGYKADIDPELMQEYKKAAQENARAVSEDQKRASAERMQEIQQAIFAAEAAKMPATFKAKWDAWRYMAMLGNAKTQVRNFAGNLAMMPYKVAKDKMAALFEKALPKEQRTKAIGTDFELLAWAKDDAKTTDVQNALKYSAKLGDDVISAQFAENRKIFDRKALEAVRKFVEKVPQAGDLVFKNDYYARSLASFLKARGYKAADIQNGAVNEAVLAEARGYAIQEAMKATFNDCNAFSDAIASIGRKHTDNAWINALNLTGEGILPFRRTPANIAVRFAEYTPAGLIKGAWDMATKVRNGDISAAAAIDQISAGMTGTAVMALGFFLAKGIGGVKITGSGTDEDEKRQGHQDYALEFSVDGQEYSYKIDWAAPANLPLFVGANIQKAMEDAGAETDVSTFTTILHGMATMFEPMLALSCMSSLNNLAEGMRNAPKGEALYSAAADIATSYFTQGIPALARQTYQATQKNKQTTFANSEDPTIRDLQKIGAQVPFAGAAFQTDKRNAWGETETTESGLERAFNAYFNPGTYKKISNDPVEKELNRLNEAQTDSVSPPEVEKTVSYTDTAGEKHKNMRLTEEQYQTMATAQGQTAKSVLDQLIASDEYKAMTDSQKAAAVNAVYNYAAEEGKKAALPDYDSNAAGWIKNAGKNPKAAIVNKVISSDLGDAMDQLVDAWKNKQPDTEAKADLDAMYQVYSGMSSQTQKAVLEDAAGRLKYFLKGRQAGVDAETFTDLYKQYWDISESRMKASEKAQRWAYDLELAQEAGTITAAQKNTLKDSMTFFQTIPAEAAKFDELTESGLSATAAQNVTRTVNNLLPEEGRKEVRDIQKLDAIVQMTLGDLETESAMRAYMTDQQEAKLDEVKDLGFDAEDYPEIYRIVDAYTSGTGKKARTIKHMQDVYGIDYAAAKKLYEVFK
jgi:hypothetical protein